MFWSETRFLKNFNRDGFRTPATRGTLLLGHYSNGWKPLERALESPAQMLQGSIMGLWSLKINSECLMILTHLAFARNTIPVLYIFKCLQILRRFYVKREQICAFPQNFHTKKLGEITVFYTVYACELLLSVNKSVFDLCIMICVIAVTVA